MTWDDLLDRLRRDGGSVIEDDFMENYGPIAAAHLGLAGGRHLRCAFGSARVAGLGFEVYIFSSEDEAEDFLGLANRSPDRWERRRNMVFHAPEGDFVPFGKILDGVFRER